jgi:hypothetical protein
MKDMNKCGIKHHNHTIVVWKQNITVDGYNNHNQIYAMLEVTCNNILCKINQRVGIESIKGG